MKMVNELNNLIATVKNYVPVEFEVNTEANVYEIEKQLKEIAHKAWTDGKIEKATYYQLYTFIRDELEILY